MLKRFKTSEYSTSIPQWLFFSLFAFPALPLKLSNLLFILLTVYLFFYWIIYKPSGVLSFLKFNILLAIPFIPYLVEFLFHFENPIMRFEMEKKLLFFIAPFTMSMYMAVVKPIGFRTCFNVFAGSVLVLSFYTLVVLLFNQVMFQPKSFENSAFIFRESFEHVSHLHPTYYGLFATISILWLVNESVNVSSKWKYVLLLSLVLLLLLDLLVAAKMPLIILAIGSVWLIFKNFKQKKKLLIIYIILVTIAAVSFLFMPSLNNRLQEINANPQTFNYFQNTVVQRQIIFDSNVKVALAHFWTGTGTRNAQFLLDYCYSVMSAGLIEAGKYNSHNQFLSFFVNYGILGLLVFVALFVVLFRFSLRYPFGIILILALSLSMLTESILERQMGVYLFILSSILIFNKNTKPE